MSTRHDLTQWKFDISQITLKLFNAIDLVSDLKIAKVHKPMLKEEAA